jgi:uncharacterized metal-binding protein YceD (DUF177 family)
VNEFSRIYDLSLPDTLQGKHTIKANPSECEALSLRFKILSIEKFEAQFTILSEDNVEGFSVDGSLYAELTQACIVSLEPVQETVKTSVFFKIRPIPKDGEPEVDDEEDDIEYIKNSRIDIGEVMTQYLSLGINPYPRKEDAVFEQKSSGKSGALADLVKFQKPSKD